MKRDKKGRFAKEDYFNESYEISLCFPSLKNFIIIILLAFILFPWAIIISKCKLLEKVFSFFDDIMTRRDEEESPKKNGIFY